MFNLYLAYPVRGQYGDSAPQASMEDNIKQAVHLGQKLRLSLGEGFNVWVPHEHEHLFTYAWQDKAITSADILSLWCNVLSLCDLLIMAHSPYQSEGMQAEYREACLKGIPTVPIYPLRWNAGMAAIREAALQIGI